MPATSTATKAPWCPAPVKEHSVMSNVTNNEHSVTASLQVVPVGAPVGGGQGTHTEEDFSKCFLLPQCRGLGVGHWRLGQKQAVLGEHCHRVKPVQPINPAGSTRCNPTSAPIAGGGAGLPAQGAKAPRGSHPTAQQHQDSRAPPNHSWP